MSKVEIKEFNGLAIFACLQFPKIGNAMEIILALDAALLFVFIKRLLLKNFILIFLFSAQPQISSTVDVVANFFRERSVSEVFNHLNIDFGGFILV